MNSRSPLVRWQAVAILIFIVALFGFVTWRLNNLIHDLDEGVYEACLVRVANIHATNERNAALAEIERSNPYQYQGPAEKATVKRRVEIYSVKLRPPDCGGKP